jgi:hypothetical protein
MGNTDEATKALRKIIAFKPQIDNTVSNFLSANHLVSAWANEKLDGNAAAISWLDAEIKKYPDDKVIKWCKEVYESKAFKDIDVSDASIRILERLM